MQILKVIISMGVVLSVLFFGTPRLYAGDDDWADAGKVLAGVVGGVVGYHILTNMYGGPSYYAPRRTYCSPQVVYYDYHDPYEYDEGYIHGYDTGYYHGYRHGRYRTPYYRRRVVHYHYY